MLTLPFLSPSPSLSYLFHFQKDMKDEFQKQQDFESERMKVLLNCLHDYIGIVNQQTHTKEA